MNQVPVLNFAGTMFTYLADWHAYLYIWSVEDVRYLTLSPLQLQ